MKLALKDLPPLSPLAVQLLELDAESIDAERRLLQVVGSDPALGARLLAVANSVAFAAPGVRYTTLETAVRRIGLRRAIHVGTSLLFIGSLGQGLSPTLNRTLWLHALTLAFAAQELAGLLRVPEPNVAYFIGLAHDLGYMAMEYLSPGTLRDAVNEAVGAGIDVKEAETRLFGIDHAEVTAQLLALWGVPGELVAPLRRHHGAVFADDALGALLAGAEELARCSDILAALYGGDASPFAALAIERAQVETYFAQRLGLDAAAVDRVVTHIVAQDGSLREAAAALTH